MSDSSSNSKEQISSTYICLEKTHLQNCTPFLEKGEVENEVYPSDKRKYHDNLKESTTSSTLFSGGISSAPFFSENTSTWKFNTSNRSNCMETTRTILIFVGFIIGVSILLVIAYYGHNHDNGTKNVRNDLTYLQIIEGEEDTFQLQKTTLLPSFLLRSEKDWTLFQKNLASHQSSLHVKVLDGPSQVVQVITSGTSSLEMLGKPEFCTSSKKASNKVLDNMIFQNVSFLHLSDLGNCRFYLNLILSNWSFPKIYHLKLERLLIREKEFEAVKKFIEKYNETLYHVEIEECYLCESPVCDVGLIPFPEHDFKLSIKRKKEIPVWV